MQVTMSGKTGISYQGIDELYPQYATELNWFEKTQYIHPYNMLIAPKVFFDIYMSTLFPLLFWMEKKKPFRRIPTNAGFPRFWLKGFLLSTCMSPALVTLKCQSLFQKTSAF